MENLLPRSRYMQLAPVIRCSFDIALMVRLAVGSFWEQTVMPA
jgi:hypothetical protein